MESYGASLAEKTCCRGDSSGRLMFCGDDNSLLARHRLENLFFGRTQQMRIALGFSLKTGTVVQTPGENFSSAQSEIHDDK